MRLRRRVSVLSLVGVGLLAGGCGASTPADYPTVSGRRVQSASMTARGAPYQLGTYELEFPDRPGRTALLVDFINGQGAVRGFAQWDHAGRTPATYVVRGWARQRTTEDELVTVFELDLNHVDVRDSRRTSVDPEDAAPRAVRVVVHEATGDVTLTRRR